jgi:integrase
MENNMDKKSTLNREAEPFYKKSHKAWYVQIGNTQHRLCDAAEKTEKVPPEGQREWHRLMARLDDEAEAEVEQGRTVVSLVDAFLASLKKQVDAEKRAQRTLDWYNDHLKSFKKFIGDQLTAAEIKKTHINRWLDSDYSKAGENYNDGAIRAVSRVFNWAKGEELVTNNPTVGCDRAGYQPRECELTDDQWNLVLSVLKEDDPFNDIVWFLYLTGSRPFEARTATDFHFDRATKALIFEREKSKGGKSRRLVVLNDKALEIVERSILGVENRLTASCHEPDAEPVRNLFVNRRGNAWTSYSLNCRFARIREELAKQKNAFDVFPYIFRHTFATRALKLGLTSSNVAALLGHKGTAMVDNVYGHLKDLKHLHNELRRTSA